MSNTHTHARMTSTMDMQQTQGEISNLLTKREIHRSVDVDRLLSSAEHSQTFLDERSLLHG